MRRYLGWIAISLLVASTNAGADEGADQERLVGLWQLQSRSASNTLTDWIFVVNGGTLQVTQLDGGKVIIKFQCSIYGSTCKITTGNSMGTISVWHDQAALVEMETKGSVIIKRRFAVLAQGNVMEMEVIPVVPSGRAETFRFRRLQAAAQGK